MEIRFLLGQLFRLSVSRFAAVPLVALAWSSFAFCGQIHTAASTGDLLKVKALLHDNPKLISSLDANGFTPLYVAALRRQTEMVALLLANKADVDAKNKDEETPLHAAAGMRAKEVVALLLANKADVNAKDNDGKTSLRYTAKWGHKDVAELLRQHGGSE
jgi:ankyrin repeat protein